MEAPGRLAKLAMEDATANGRQGRGSILLFASGNGGIYKDWCSFDGYANSIHTITVGAVDYVGKLPSYGELCPAQLVAAYTGGTTLNTKTGSQMNIVSYINTALFGSTDRLFIQPTTDIRLNCDNKHPCCTREHTGTSAATPFVSAIIALLLSQRYLKPM